MSFFFLACTPRTGNVWARRILAGAIGGAEVAAHRPEEIPWADLKPPCIVAMHWHRTPELCDLLRRADFQVMVTVRHPLDVLISILHFCQYEPATARWLEGEGGDESPLFGADPAGPQFLQYALGERARSLLGISAEWYASARAVIRYEQLVADPEGTLERTLPLLGCEARAPLSEVVRNNTLARLRPLSRHHFWRGEPGLWRRLIPPDHARQIYHCHRDLFELWGYARPAEASLSAAEARENWRQLCEPDQPAPAAGDPAS